MLPAAQFVSGLKSEETEANCVAGQQDSRFEVHQPEAGAQKSQQRHAADSQDRERQRVNQYPSGFATRSSGRYRAGI